jgi:hypothetical protein
MAYERLSDFVPELHEDVPCVQPVMLMMLLLKITDDLVHDAE